jgi:hypothetical protein
MLGDDCGESDGDFGVAHSPHATPVICCLTCTYQGCCPMRGSAALWWWPSASLCCCCLPCSATTDTELSYSSHITYCQPLAKVKLPCAQPTKHMPWRRVGERMYRSTFPWPRREMKLGSQLHTLATLPQGKGSSFSLDRRLGGLRTCLDDREVRLFTLQGPELRPLGRPARSQPQCRMYWVQYPKWQPRQ